MTFNRGSKASWLKLMPGISASPQLQFWGNDAPASLHNSECRQSPSEMHRLILDRWDKKWDTEFVTGSCLTVFVGLPVVLQDRHHSVGVLRLEHGILPRLSIIHCAAACGAAAGVRCRVRDNRVRMHPLYGDPNPSVNRDYHKSFAHVPPSYPLLLDFLRGGETRRPANLCGSHSMRASTQDSLQRDTRSRGDQRIDYSRDAPAPHRRSLVERAKERCQSPPEANHSGWNLVIVEWVSSKICLDIIRFSTKLDLCSFFDVT